MRGGLEITPGRLLMSLALPLGGRWPCVGRCSVCRANRVPRRQRGCGSSHFAPWKEPRFLCPFSQEEVLAPRKGHPGAHLDGRVWRGGLGQQVTRGHTGTVQVSALHHTLRPPGHRSPCSSPLGARARGASQTEPSPDGLSLLSHRNSHVPGNATGTGQGFLSFPGLSFPVPDSHVAPGHSLQTPSRGTALEKEGQRPLPNT